MEAANGYPLQQHSTSTSSSPPTARLQFHHFQQPRHSQLYNLLPPSYTPPITLPPLSHTNLHHFNERSRDPQHQYQHVYNIKHVDSSKTQDDFMPSTSDFVKKLYKILEDPEFRNVVSWGPLGDYFVVKDMNEFTKSILPRMFKHSNFASFVRQLNKYNFHKVKNTDDNLSDEQTWTFRHPDFHADRREALAKIKRKDPAQRKTANLPSSTATSLSANNSQHHHTSSPYPTNRRSPSPPHSYLATPTAAISPHHKSHLLSLESNFDSRLSNIESNFDSHLSNIEYFDSRLSNIESNFDSHLSNIESSFDSRLSNIQSTYESRIHSLESAYETCFRGVEKNYQCVLAELAAFHSGVTQQDGVLKSLIRGFLGEDGKQQRTSPPTMLVNHQQMTAPTSGCLLPSASGTTMEDRLETYRQQLDQQRSQSQDHNPSQSQSSSSRVKAPSSSSRSNCALLSPQNTRISGPTSTNSTSSTTTSTPTLTSTLTSTRNSAMDRTSHDHNHDQHTAGHLVPRDMAAVGEEVGNCWNFDANNITSETVGTQGVDDDEDVEIIPPPVIHPRPSRPTPRITSTPLPSSSLPPPPTASPTTTTAPTPTPPIPTTASTSSPSHQTLRVRRAAFVPGWAVPPRVLLVDDDAVIRKLSSKFLNIFGCTTDIAVDGIGAVMKMNLEKYDLVLMATNLIRKSDRGTPIISMTVNSRPDEIMEYYSSGMNDILPKLFTKEDLMGMLEEHLTRLKVMQQKTVIPRSVGVPPLSGANFEQVLVTNAMIVQQQQQMQQGLSAAPVAGLLVGGDNNNTTDDRLSSPILPPSSQSQQLQQQSSQLSFTSLLTMGEDDERINNPHAGMGLSDDHYILQNLFNGERFMGMGMDGGPGGGSVGGGGGSSDSGGGVGGNGGGGRMKRTIDDVGYVSDERGGKRSRFEVVE